MKNSTNTFGKRAGRILAALLLSYLSTTLPAQSVWTGAVNTNWNNAANWTGGVPAAGKTVTIFTCTTCPVINTTGNQSAFVQVYAGGKLTIGASGSLAISNPGGPGLKTQATSQVNVNQGGSLAVQNFWGEGIAVGGTFQNGGTISINGGHTGIAVSAGASFTNNVNGTTTVTGYSLNYAMTSSGTVLNNGILTLDDANNDGISQQTGTITNGVSGTLTITKTGVNGIFTKSTFNNNGVLNIDNGLNGIYAIYATFNNNAGGKLTITGSAFLNDGIYLDPATFKNSGELSIQNAGSKGIEISSGSTFNNFSKITLNVPAWAGIFNVGGSNFTNRPCSLIETNAPVVNYANFTNKGIIKSTAASVSSVGVNDGAVIGAFTVASGNVPITNTEAGYVWTGCASSDWSSPYNWYQLGLPGSFDAAIVQNVANASGNAPVVNNSALGILKLRLDNGALLTIANGGTLSVRTPVSWIPSNAGIETGGKLKVNTGGSFSAQDVSLSGTIDNSGSFSLGCRIVGAGGMNIEGGTFNNLAGGNFSSSACSPQGAGATVSLTNSANFNNSGIVTMQGVARCSLVMSKLTINPGGSFIITGDGAGGIIGSNGSTLNNLGFLGSGFISWTNSTFTNSGEMQLHNHSPGFFAENSTCTNSGNMWLTLAYMLLYNGTFNNTGSIKIENAFDNAFNSSAQFTNSGSLEVQFYTPTTHHAMIIFDGHFNNTPSGNVWVRGMSYGLINWGGFTNKGIFKVENAAGRGIEHNSFTGKPFLNEATGQIIIDGAVDIGLATFQTQLVNHGTITIKNTHGGLANVGGAENKATGRIFINDVIGDGIPSWGNFYNKGLIRVVNPSLAGVVVADNEFATEGQLYCTNAGTIGILNYDYFKNLGYASIENPGAEAVKHFGFKFENTLSSSVLDIANVLNAPAIYTFSGVFNSGKINITNAPFAVLTDASGGYLNNHPCAELRVDGKIDNGYLMNNEGLLKTTYAGANASGGTLNNTGVIEDVYDSFNGVTFTNAAIRVRPIFGQVGGFIQNALEIGGAPPFQIGTTWYRNANLTNPGGTYIPGVNTFTPTVGVGTHTLYFTVRDLLNNCTKTVSVQVSISSALKGEGLAARPAITLTNYPNPFAESTTIKLSLPFEAEGKLVLYDNFGRLVEVIYDGELRKDELYEFNFDASGKRVASYLASLVLSDGRAFSIRLVKAETR